MSGISLRVHHRETAQRCAARHKPSNVGRFLLELLYFKFLPFIQGPRNCLGQYLALLEARVVLGTLVRRYAFAPSKAQGKKHTKAIPIAPANGMHFTVS